MMKRLVVLAALVIAAGTAAAWGAVGRCIGAFHRAGVFHADLTAQADDGTATAKYVSSGGRTGSVPLQCGN